MKILDYKNKFQLIIDIIFRPNKVNEKIHSKKQDIVEKLEKDFTERLQKIGYDQYKNGIVTRNNSSSNQIAIMKTAIVKEDGQVHASVEHKYTKPIKIRLPYFSDQFSNNQQKEIAAKELSNILIKNNFLQTKVSIETNEVIIYINVFN